MKILINQTIWRNERTDIDDYKKKFLKLFVSDMDIIPMFLNFIIKPIYKGYYNPICIFINTKKNYRFFWTNKMIRLYLFKIFKIFKFKYLLHV